MPYFDSVADAYFDRYREDSIGEHARRERKASVLEPLEGVRGRLPDVGCGPGVMVQDLLDQGLEVWGLDAAPGMIEHYRERFAKTSRAHFVLREATKLSFPDGIFDALISIGVLDRLHIILVLNREKVRNDKELVCSVSFTSWMSLGSSRKPNFDSLPTIPCWRSVPSIFLGFGSTNGYM